MASTSWTTATRKRGTRIPRFVHFPHGPEGVTKVGVRRNLRSSRKGKNVDLTEQTSQLADTGQGLPGSMEHWYAVQTRARHEKAVAYRLCERGVTTFLPTVREVHRWKDRKKTLDLPLFSCYLFVKLAPINQERQRVLRTESVLGLVGNLQGLGTPIPHEQIDAVRILVNEQLPWSSHPFLKIGQRVRVRGGALDGMEGILQSRRGDHKLVISVDAMQRSLAVQIDGYDVEPV